MPIDKRQNEADRRAPGPWENATPPPAPVRPPSKVGRPRNHWRLILFLLVMMSVGVRAYKDLSRPGAWSYWKDLYLSSSLTASVVTMPALDGSGSNRPTLIIEGTIGAAAASWFRQQIDSAHLAAGDTVMMSSPGGDVGQAVIMGETIRVRGLSTAVAAGADASGGIEPGYCASACVLVYAGGKPRFDIRGSRLGVHRFVTETAGGDPVAETQRTEGMILNYMTRMGVSSTIVEAMSATRDVRWLSEQEAAAMKLTTQPAWRP